MALDLDKIRSLACRVAASHGLEVVDIEYLGNPKQRALRIYIEKDAVSRAALAISSESEELKLPDNISVDQLAGITVDDCQIFSEDFGTVLDVEELVPGEDYTLEISSPGLDRALRSRQDYIRFTGSIVKLRTIEPIEKNSHWQGRITGVDDRSVELDLSPAVRKKSKKAAAVPGRKVTIALSNILKANLVPEI